MYIENIKTLMNSEFRNITGMASIQYIGGFVAL